MKPPGTFRTHLCHGAGVVPHSRHPSGAHKHVARDADVLEADLDSRGRHADPAAGKHMEEAEEEH